jgi:very-short-patch-repair endonuclease
VPGKSNWNMEEEQLLRHYFPYLPTEDMVIMFHNRTASAIRGRAANLGLHKTVEVIKITLDRKREKSRAAHIHPHPSKKLKTLHECVVCGISFEALDKTETWRQKWNRTNRTCCSISCSRISQSRKTSGENHWNYNGGKPIVTCRFCGKLFQTQHYDLTNRGHYCSRRCNATANCQGLRSLGINGYHSSSNWIVDFYLPDNNIVLEVDGKYWHSLPKMKVRDHIKDKYLTKWGYTVIRLCEDDIRRDVVSTLQGALSNIENAVPN